MTRFALDNLIRAGKVRYIGTSTYAAWQVVKSIAIARELGLNRFICEQPPYNLLDRRIERDLLPMAQSYGISTIPWSPLAGGLLIGKYTRDTPPPADSRFGDLANSPHLQRRWQGCKSYLTVLLHCPPKRLLRRTNERTDCRIDLGSQPSR